MHRPSSGVGFRTGDSLRVRAPRVLRGEIYCILDEEEILLKPFDTVIVQGVNHGWANRGTEPCLMIGVLLDADCNDHAASDELAVM